MDDMYQHPVYFECHSLPKEQMKRIEAHFRVRRRSGGGDCGPLRRVNDTIYSVAFKNQKDQQAVLQRSEHVVDGLVLTVRGSLEPHTSSPSQDFTAPVQSTQCIPASSPPSSDEIYELQLDSHILCYLKECPKAGKELEKELASVGCSAQLYPEEGRALVSRLAQPNSAHGVRNLKSEVDKLFEIYECHYVVDPHKVRALLQSCSSCPATDEVKVYSEDGMAVVVGECSQVSARLTDVEMLVRYPSEKDELLSVAHDLASLSLSEVNATVASHILCDGLEVLVCQGDITKQEADALVNAANEDLEHGGGVAAALSKAGGPQVQEESRAIVKQNGKIPTGDVVVTTGGELNCMKLLHAVGPVAGKSGGRDRILLEKTVNSALDLAEMMEIQSIAMPCISSGTFGVPVTVCSEAIVTAVKEFGSQGGRSLRKIILIDNRGEVVRAMQEACDRLLQGISTGNGAPRDLGFRMGADAQDAARGATTGVPGGSVHVEIVEGTIETQKVDALVSPMVGSDPLSTRVGNTLFQNVGPQLTAKFREEGGNEMEPGDTVLVQGLAKLPSNAVFFLSLIPWDDDPDGPAVQVLRLAINNILTSCENRGFGSVALPVLGVGIALQFPEGVAHSVLLEEVHAFEQKRDSRTPFLVCIVIPPNGGESSEAFKSAQEAFQLTKDVHQPDQVSNTRMILLGKTGYGKSSLANTIFGEDLFATNHSPNSGTKKCQAETKTVNGRSITLIDTPGFFDAARSEEELKPEIVRCITECAPGPHAFVIVLKVEKFTEHEQAVIKEICRDFSEDALKYAVVVFTHGNQLPKGMKIEEFVKQNENLSDLVMKCGGRCHVVDNKYWKNDLQNNYRSNEFQVEEILTTIDKMVMGNNGGYYTNKVFQEVERVIRIEEERIKQNTSGNVAREEIRKQAVIRVSDRFLIQLAGTATGMVLGAFFGVAMMVRLVVQVLKESAGLIKAAKDIPALGGVAAAVGGGDAVLAVGVLGAAAGGAFGGFIGYEEAEGAETPLEAAEMAANAVINRGKEMLNLQRQLQR